MDKNLTDYIDTNMLTHFTNHMKRAYASFYKERFRERQDRGEHDPDWGASRDALFDFVDFWNTLGETITEGEDGERTTKY